MSDTQTALIVGAGPVLGAAPGPAVQGCRHDGGGGAAPGRPTAGPGRGDRRPRLRLRRHRRRRGGGAVRGSGGGARAARPGGLQLRRLPAGERAGNRGAGFRDLLAGRLPGRFPGRPTGGPGHGRARPWQHHLHRRHRQPARRRQLRQSGGRQVRLARPDPEPGARAGPPRRARGARHHRRTDPIRAVCAVGEGAAGGRLPGPRRRSPRRIINCTGSRAAPGPTSWT